MIVTCISFGSYWWTRPGFDPHTGVLQLARTAYFNTTGIRHGRSVSHGYEVAGRIRINAWMKPLVTCVEDVVGGTFEADPVETYRDTNQLLLRRWAAGGTPDFYLVCLRGDLDGEIDFQIKWRSGNVVIFSKTNYRGSQETLLLMASDATITTTLGEWRVECTKLKATLELQ
jgi:hypothetical protein